MVSVCLSLLRWDEQIFILDRQTLPAAWKNNFDWVEELELHRIARDGLRNISELLFGGFS